MELSCEKEVITFLEPAVVEPQSVELGQEVRLSDGMPDIERILGVWGQPTVRAHSWDSEQLTASGGVMAWVLYRGTDGSVQSLDAYVPFSAAWDLPPDCPEGTFTVGVHLRFADGRTVSARRIGLRMGLGLIPRALRYRQEEAVHWEANPAVEVLTKCYPMRLLRTAGEKHFVLEEDLPIGAGSASSVVSLSLNPVCTDCRVLGEKLAFRGNANLHVLYAGTDGQLFCEDYPMNFSQFTMLDEIYSTRAEAAVNLCPEGVETDVQEGSLHVKLSLCAGYTVGDVTDLVLAEDAYAPGKALKLEKVTLPIPSVLDDFNSTVEFEKSLGERMESILDLCVCTDAPVRRASDGKLLLRGSIQALGLDAGGAMVGSAARWEQTADLAVNPGARLLCDCEGPAVVRTEPSGEGMTAHAVVNLHLCCLCGEGYGAVSAMELEQNPGNAAAPSLILRRFGGSLWDLSKACNARASDIRRVNRLEGEPVPGQMLLIPVCH